MAKQCLALLDVLMIFIKHMHALQRPRVGMLWKLHLTLASAQDLIPSCSNNRGLECNCH
jgi:hypothetical protein